MPDSTPNLGAGPDFYEMLKFDYLTEFEVLRDVNGVGVKFSKVSDGNDC